MGLRVLGIRFGVMDFGGLLGVSGFAAERERLQTSLKGGFLRLGHMLPIDRLVDPRHDREQSLRTCTIAFLLFDSAPLLLGSLHMS